MSCDVVLCVVLPETKLLVPYIMMSLNLLDLIRSKKMETNIHNDVFTKSREHPKVKTAINLYAYLM